MKLSTRNRPPAEITKVVKGEPAAKVIARVGDKHIVVLVSRESVGKPGVAVGRQVMVLVKATNVS